MEAKKKKNKNGAIMEMANLRCIHAYCGMPMCGGSLKFFE